MEDHQRKMWDENTEVIRDYENRVRLRNHDPQLLNSPNHAVDWEDRPSRFNTHLNSSRVPLFDSLSAGTIYPAAHTNPTKLASAAVSLPDLSDFLLLSSGPLRRKLSLNWEIGAYQASTCHGAIYGRGTASGGGLYPVGVYVLARRIYGIAPGLYHYEDAHHCLARLRMGDFSEIIDTVFAFAPASAADFLFVLTVNFWKTCFKYQNFAYQVVTHDVGAYLASMEQAAGALGWPSTIVYKFHDQLLSSLLGEDQEKEVPFAAMVVGKHLLAESVSVAPTKQTGRQFKIFPKITNERVERSERVFIPQYLSAVHGATLLTEVDRSRFDSSVLDLGKPRHRQPLSRAELYGLCNRRETSWGGFRADPPMRCAQVLEILSLVSEGVGYAPDVYGRRVCLPMLRLSVWIQSVAGLSRGHYDYSYSDEALQAQKTSGNCDQNDVPFRLHNHNLSQTSMMLIVVGRLDLALKTFGARGVRVMNAESGIAAQRAYFAAELNSLGCAAVLGFDPQEAGTVLGLDHAQEVPLLLILIGNKCPRAFAYDFRFYSVPSIRSGLGTLGNNGQS